MRKLNSLLTVFHFNALANSCMRTLRAHGLSTESYSVMPSLLSNLHLVVRKGYN